MARIMGSVMHRRNRREANGENHAAANEQTNKACHDALRNAYSDRNRFGGHVTLRETVERKTNINRQVS